MQKQQQPPVLAIQVGNTRIKIAVFRHDDPEEVVFLSKDDVSGAVEKAASMYESIGAEADASVVVASVHPKTSTALIGALRDQLACEVYEVPTDMPVPIGVCLAPGAKPGVDRLLNAAAAWDKLRQACVVVDAGTCITVDFVDGEGVFHGGAIAPGLRMQLKALHEHTAALPLIEVDGMFDVPSGTAWGADTREAMLRGVYHGARGLVWRLVEKYAEEYGAFPVVIATGGDSASLFSDDELITQIVPDLVLRGVAIAARHALEPDAAELRAFESTTEATRHLRHGLGGEGFSLLPSQTESKPSATDRVRHEHQEDHHEGGCGDGCGCGHDEDA
jgi:type III pantothenate kinase